MFVARSRQGVCTVRRSGPLACALGLLVACAGPAARADVLTSPPIDYSIYREGEVKRIEKRFSAWQLTCDEIKRLSRKFCSLRGVARADDGTIVAAITVSTDEDGRPAAILRVPFGTVLSSGVTLRRKGQTPKQTPIDRALRASICDQSGCEVLWPLATEDVRTLVANGFVLLAFRMTRPPPVIGPLMAASVPIEGVIQTTGFADALQASMSR